MKVQYNIFYGILTNGDSTERKTTADRDVNKDAARILEALVPTSAPDNTKRALAELYIRLIQTDKDMQQILAEIDPINSYKLHSFRPAFATQHIIDTVVNNIKKLGIPNEETSSLPFDYIKTALKALLDELRGN